MRKIIFVFLIFLSFFSSNSFVFGAEDNFFNEKNEILIEKFVERAKNIIEKK
jgi:hypothetical protein